MDVVGVCPTPEDAEECRKCFAVGIEKFCGNLPKGVSEASRRVGTLQDVVVCDVSDAVQVKTVCENLFQTPSISLLVTNAGIMATPPALSRQGYEMQFATHHIGHSIMALTLLSSVERHPRAARIVVVTSAAAAGGEISQQTTYTTHAQEVELFLRKADRFKAYSNAKLCNAVFCGALARHVEKRQLNVEVNMLHPGPVRSRVLCNSRLPWTSLLNSDLSGLLRLSPVISACYVTDLCLNQRHRGVNGHYFRMGEDQTVRLGGFLSNERNRHNYIVDSIWFTGVPCPKVSLSPAAQEWLFKESLDYFHRAS
jgi:NAD(P)-dependent dehydrogenase (short-subunit alcohol dehydrogenase family)